MKVLYNEGRVQGLSSYELYVRQMLSRNPEAHILTESQWLAASLSTNNSMVLKISEGTTSGYHDYILPEGSDLCGCTCVFASIFEGAATFDGIWATRIDDYGRLISNTANRFPVTPGEPEDVPAKEDLRMSQQFLDQCMEFMKISSGLVLQPGEWSDNIYQEELLNEAGITIVTEEGEAILADVSNYEIRMTLTADLSRRGFVRILFTEPVEHDFYIFLHGFAYKNILAGMSGFENLLTSTHPENGDFLGPQAFPWAVQIVFLYTGTMLSVLRQTAADMVELYHQVIDDTDYYYTTAEQLNAKYVELTLRYNTLMEQFSTVVSHVTELENVVNSYSDAIDGLSNRISELETSQTEQDTRLDTMDNSIRTLSTKCTSTQDLANDVARRVDTLRSDMNSQIAQVNQTIDDTNTAIEELGGKVGDLNDLQTTAKTNLVYAINEVNSKV